MTDGAKSEILQILGIVEKIKNLLDEKADIFCNSMVDEFERTLQKYQEGVISAGNRIERCLLEDLSGDIISKLEDYCEEIFQLSQCIRNIEQYRLKMVCLNKMHSEIEDRIQRIPTRKMAAFLPYKFSMWDSLESIYLATCDDPDWDAVIVPIPYTERESDGEPQWIYEGVELYKGMNAVSFQEFLLPEQMPDVIYIHNPYDGCNNVTSLPLEYFSENLKKYCKKLVYVPYFFNGSELPGAHRKLPSYDNFDYIVVASDTAAKQLAEYNNPEKVLALGSPKIDRMLWMNENYTLPEEWKNRIGGRKTVLYNVSLNSMLQNKSQAILKMKYVFDYFRRNQDVVLWWRPHPLLKSTLKTMCPELLGEYETLEEKFVCEKIGIYDTTTDSNRAIAATDAFIGDYSSMCSLYGVVGKPIYLMDTTSIDEPTQKEKSRINLIYPQYDESGMASKDGKFYVYSTEYRALCLLNVDNFELEVVKQFDDLYCRVQSYNFDDIKKAKILFFPSDRSNKTVEYRVSTNSCTEIDDFDGIALQRYGSIIDLDSMWYLTPREDTVGIFLDKETHSQEMTENYNNELQSFRSYVCDQLMSGARKRIGDEIYQLAWSIGYMLVTNLKDRTSRLISIGNGDVRYSGFSYVDNKFYLYEYEGKLIDIWQPEENRITRLVDFPEGYIGICSANSTILPYAIVAGIQNDRELIIMPYQGNMILSLNLDTNDITRYDIELPYEEGQRKASYYNEMCNYISLCVVDSDTLLTQTSYDKSVLRINMKDKTVEMNECLVPASLYESARLSVAECAARDGYKSPYWIFENGIHCTLNDMIEFVKDPKGWDAKAQHDASCDGVINADGTCGRKIHEYIKSTV